MQGGSSATVLVADDEEMLLRLVDSVLRRSGFRVLTAATGTEAVEIFRRESAVIGAVLIDAGMPPSGAAPILRSMLALRGGVGVVVSSGAPPRDEIQELLAGCGGLFVSKPFDPETLVSAIRAVSPPGDS
jgi:DNA-binding response OmpR family regulator